MANSDDEWEDDESEQYALEIQGYSNSSEETLVFDLVSKMKIIGIDTPNPIMQIDGHIFKGRVGSQIFEAFIEIFRTVRKYDWFVFIFEWRYRKNKWRS